MKFGLASAKQSESDNSGRWTNMFYYRFHALCNPSVRLRNSLAARRKQHCRCMLCAERPVVGR